jgi:hypothetical protein
MVLCTAPRGLHLTIEMSLKAIHIVFITASTLLAFGFGGWSLRHYVRGSGNTVDLVLGVVSIALAIGLIIYGRYFLRKLKDTSYL